jgi:hypothetical protein
MSNVLNKFMATRKDLPEIRYTLPASGEELLLRPFTTKEQKAILKAIEKEDQVLIGEAFDQLLRQCVINDKFRPEDLLSKDRECLLIKLRQESVKEEYSYNWSCAKCKKDNVKTVELSDLPFNELVGQGNKTKIIELDTFDAKLELGVSTRDDEKKILKYAQRNSSVKEERLSQTEILNGAYAAVIKDMISIEKKDIKDEEGNVTTEEREIKEKVGFDDRIKILESISIADKSKIKVFFDELAEYGYDMELGELPCKFCGHEEEHSLEWLTFFIL